MSHHLIDDSDDDDCEAYTMETYTQAGGSMLQGTEKLDLDARMSELPPEQRGIGREIYERNRTQAAPPAGMTIRDSSNGVSTNTGPKGVIADFEEAKKNLRSQRMMERLRREKAIQGKLRVEQFVQDDQQQQQQEQKQQEKQQKQKVTSKTLVTRCCIIVHHTTYLFKENVITCYIVFLLLRYLH